jgi:hypothetical protein
MSVLLQNIEVVNHSSDGFKISDILDSLPAALEKKPDIVILCWDSDCSDVDEKKLNRLDVMKRRSEFAETLSLLIANVHVTGSYLIGKHSNRIIQSIAYLVTCLSVTDIYIMLCCVVL